ncbi:MAG: GntR family transcriptional regulator [Clostridiaceae bacterium]|nr:GntR family transcriptional regulator [Clostridiaceae bacterium]
MRRGESNQDKIYLQLRGEMMTLALKPGEVLRAQELAEHLGVSRTPVREAFIRLQRDGLVNILPQRETTVSLIDLGRVMQERFVRESLELGVAAQLSARGSIGCLQGLNELIERQMLAGLEGRTDDLYASDDAFHRLLFEEAGQLFGWELVQQGCTHYHRLRLLSLRSRSASEVVIMGHQEVLRALESGQQKRLEEVLTLHLRQIENDILSLRGQYPQYFLPPEQ